MYNLPPVHADSKVDIEDSCNCNCCFSFGKRKKRQIEQDDKIQEVVVKVRRQNGKPDLGKKY